MTQLLRSIPEDVRQLKSEMEENFMGFSDNYARSMIADCINNKVSHAQTQVFEQLITYTVNPNIYTH